MHWNRNLILNEKTLLTNCLTAAWMLERKWPERWDRREVPAGDETGMDTLAVIGVRRSPALRRTC